MRARPPVTAVVPVFDSVESLTRCVTSLVSQSEPPSQIVLVDDGSTDGSGVLCDLLARKHDAVTVIHKPNGGLSSARNAGVAISTGEYVVFVDSDDWLERHAIGTLLDAAESADADIVRMGHSVATVDTKSEVPADIRPGVYEGREAVGAVLARMLEGLAQSYSCLLFVRASVLRRHPFDENLRFMEDMAFVSTLLGKDLTLVVIPEPLYVYFLNSQGLSRSRDGAQWKIESYAASTAQVVSAAVTLFGADSDVARSTRTASATSFARYVLSCVARGAISRVDFFGMVKTGALGQSLVWATGGRGADGCLARVLLTSMAQGKPRIPWLVGMCLRPFAVFRDLVRGMARAIRSVPARSRSIRRHWPPAARH